MPCADVVRVVTQGTVTGGAGLVPDAVEVVEVARSARGQVLVVADGRRSDRLYTPRGRVIEALKRARCPSLVLQVAQGSTAL